MPLSWWEGERKRVLEPQICKLADANVLRSRKFGKRLKSNEENRIWSVAMACAELHHATGMLHAVPNNGYNGCRG